MERATIESRLLAALQSASSWLPDEQLSDMSDLTRAGEPGIALENFCTQLYENDVQVPLALFNDLRKLGEAMGIDQSYWERLARPRTPRLRNRFFGDA